MKYGLDFKAPTTIKGDDGWRPVMVNKLVRRLFDTATDVARYEQQLKATNGQLETRFVEVYDDTYRL